MIKLNKIMALGAGLLFAASNAAAAPTLIVNAGILTGANNVLVDNVYYDVSFTDGTCIALFSGCNQSSDFIFNTAAAALLAVTALQDTVFLDIAAGDFDSNPALTSGCSSLTDCSVFVPYERPSGPPTVRIGLFRNEAPPEPDLVFTDRFFINSTTSNDGVRVFAVFTAAANPPPAVPEPASWAMLIAGFGLTGAMARRRRPQLA